MDNQPVTFGVKNPENQQLLNDLSRYRDAAIIGYTQGRAQSAANLLKSKNKAEEDLKKEFLDIPEEIRNARYPGIDHDFKAAANRIEFNYQMGQLGDMNDTGAATRLSALKERIPESSRKDFIETDLYKNAVQENTSNKERVTMANNLHDQLIRMKAALDAGDMTLAGNIGKTGVMKSVNSLQGKDAVSGGEQSTRYQDLLSLPDILIQSGGGSVLKTILSRVAMAKQKGDEKAYNSAISEWNALASKAVEADPERFYRTAYELHNAAVDTASGNVDRVINMTSPFHAEKYLQAVKPKRLPDLVAPTAAPSNVNPFTQTAPVSAGRPAAVSSGSTQTSPAPSQATPSGQLTPQQMRQLEAELQKRKGGK